MFVFQSFLPLALAALTRGPSWELGTGPVQASPSCAPGSSSEAVQPLWDTPGFKQLVPPRPAAWKKEQQDCPGDLAGDVGFECSRAKVKRAGTTESKICWRVDGTKWFTSEERSQRILFFYQPTMPSEESVFPGMESSVTSQTYHVHFPLLYIFAARVFCQRLWSNAATAGDNKPFAYNFHPVK